MYVNVILMPGNYLNFFDCMNLVFFYVNMSILFFYNGGSHFISAAYLCYTNMKLFDHG